jgi:hypothetical protein
MIVTANGVSRTAREFPRLRGGDRVRAVLLDGQTVEGAVAVGLEYHIVLRGRYEPLWPDEVETLEITEARGT